MENRSLWTAMFEPLLNDAGQFKYSAYKLAFKTLTNKKILKAVQVELAAQIASIIGRGIKPTHLDSHKHFHCFPPVYKIVCSLAADFNIRAIRWPWEPETVCCGDWPKVGSYGQSPHLFSKANGFKMPKA